MKTAGIVICNPDIIRLQENINEILSQVDCLFIYMNSVIASDLVSVSEKVIFLNDGQNNGIAKGLNSIMLEASKQGASWCLLLDQDSIVSKEYINTMERYTGLDDVAIITPHVLDLNEDSSINKIKINPGVVEEIDMCITSGSNVSIHLRNLIVL